ncbi:hypothetical protein NYE59_24035 [Paenibacillus sp. FSL L8-0323]|uniref:hypothetical protein n=1 Tax=Paenibacillus sp. FSL L8-0323 TaxID=2975330 RepID=UPI0030F638D8
MNVLDNKEALKLIKQEFENNLKDGLLNLQVKWLIEQAEKYQIVEDAYRNGSLDDLDEAFNKTLSD